MALHDCSARLKEMEHFASSYVFSEIFVMYDLTALIMYFPLLETHIITELEFTYFIMK